MNQDTEREPGLSGDNAASENASPVRRPWWKVEIPPRLLASLAAVLVIVVLGVLGTTIGRDWIEQSSRANIGPHEAPPEEWKGIRFGMTRREFAEHLVAAGVPWRSIQPPGTGPSRWAAHVNAQLGPYSTHEFAVRFSDGMRWDYGRHPAPSDETVDAERLIGALDPDARLDGVMWKVQPSEYDRRNEAVPVEILKVLGTPHSVKPEVTGFGKLHHWEWPGLKGYYYTIDSSLTLQTPEAVEAAAPEAEGGPIESADKG